MLRTFRGAFLVTAVALVLGLLYGGLEGLALTAILGVLEFTFSFDNAVVNAKVLGRMSASWQRLFLTVGIAIAVFGMRFLFPLLVVSVTAALAPDEALRLAFAGGTSEEPGTYAHQLQQAHPMIAAFGGIFLLLIFLDFVLDAEREVSWLSWLEKPLARIGKLDQLPVVVALVALVVVAETLAGDDAETVLVAGALGAATYLVVNAGGSLLEERVLEESESPASPPVEDGSRAAGIHGTAPLAAELALLTGRAAFMSFLYLEVLDASFSFDGVIGAFAITSDPVIIALGLGLIGAIFVRSLTVHLVRQRTLGRYVYLEHGAHWSIGVLAVVLLVSIAHEVPEVVTGCIGIAFIGAAYLSSLGRNHRLDRAGAQNGAGGAAGAAAAADGPAAPTERSRRAG